jgi:hypothetical protein
MVWYIDMEAYQFNGCYIVKELAIVNEDKQCFHYLIRNPKNIPTRPKTAATYHQFKRHRLGWTYGNCSFSSSILDIQQRIKNDTVLCKGLEKTKFLEKWLPQIQDAEWITTSFNKLNNCYNEMCDNRHSIHCARRKVHELMYADKLYKSLQSLATSSPDITPKLIVAVSRIILE